ncbi:hypothetical protein TBLA_0H01110 [Henningerozyma blattae CBS 6284]|uniref:RNase MRP protein 1 RNA binding domain-containing protein n=1 Tax=Henningerozyma blattae (strain ATCC 34711 / CBS 6284 / DSM 70876 / NBRC 10599 / NRRL Y-10934 / UCD 77-7) TaxID=1071380 RepID=I2H7P7_HENB6|nr:hypothetical protein TBLA_0H01110 [Tetrapisispora blattae CBS 6284]CCH62399.1 hypothetical protein TBLA_0H01110 [Tetrapisispora blattae CBS 6284]
MAESTSIDVNNLFSKLYQEFRLVHLIYHRNKNQHKAAIWWKRLNMLKRSCSQVIELLQRYKNSWKDSQLIKLYRLLHNFLKKQLSKMYYEFNGVIALGQFITLGVVLVGLLSRVNSIYTQLMELFFPDFKRLKIMPMIKNRDGLKNETEMEKLLEYVTNEELGEDINEDFLSNKSIKSSSMTPVDVPETQILEPNINSNANKIKKKSKKKKKSKSAIDDIFS